MSNPGRHRRFVAWLAMAAMWLVVAGSVVSRTVPALHAAMPGHAAMDMGGGQPGHPAPRQHLLDKCAYCDLLAHSPVIAEVPWVPPQLPRTRPVPADLPAAQPWQRRVPLFLPPRGPPPYAGG